MATLLAQKFKIKEGFNLRTINAPADFKKQLGVLPPDVTITTRGKTFQQLHWFVLNKAQLDKELPKVMPLVWVVTAKREETRKQRVTDTLDRLLKGWKNPRNM